MSLRVWWGTMFKLNSWSSNSNVKTYNLLTACMLELQREKDENKEAPRDDKETVKEEKTAKKLQKEHGERETHVRLLPIL